MEYITEMFFNQNHIYLKPNNFQTIVYRKKYVVVTSAFKEWVNIRTYIYGNSTFLNYKYTFIIV